MTVKIGECQRCGLTGGAVLSYEANGVACSRWTCPQCGSRTEELLKVTDIQARHFLARRIEMQSRVDELVAKMERICWEQGIPLVDVENHPTKLGEVLSDIRQAVSDPVLVSKSS